MCSRCLYCVGSRLRALGSLVANCDGHELRSNLGRYNGIMNRDNIGILSLSLLLTIITVIAILRSNISHKKDEVKNPDAYL